MKFYYQSGKTSLDQQLIMLHGKWKMLIGEVDEALNLFVEAAAQMERDLGKASFKTLKFLWKTGEIYLKRGQLEDAMGFFSIIKTGPAYYLKYIDLLQ